MLPDNTLKTQEKAESDITHYRRQGKSMMLTVPAALREFLNWQEGDVLFVSCHRNTLVIMPARGAMVERIAEYVEATKHLN